MPKPENEDGILHRLETVPGNATGTAARNGRFCQSQRDTGAHQPMTTKNPHGLSNKGVSGFRDFFVVQRSIDADRELRSF
jgi:hypothetical protein